jgi:hypothetical protein
MASFLLLYDAVSASAFEFQLLAFIKSNRHITQWLRPFGGCYLLKSSSSLIAICDSFTEFFGFSNQYILTKMTSDTTGGILPDYAWKWLNEPEPSSLGDLLSKYIEASEDERKPRPSIPPTFDSR